MNTARMLSKLPVLTILIALVFMAGCRPKPEAGNEPDDASPTGGKDVMAAEPEAPAAAKELPHLVGAVEFNGHYYKVIMSPNTSWHEQKKICESLGGYLCVIETKEEQEFIAKLADWEYLSLGATDEEEEGEWKWVNGAAFDYTAWMEGQPNNYGGEEHYLATYDEGLWVDVAEEGRQFWMPVGFICEWEKTAAEREAEEKAAKEAAEKGENKDKEE